MRVARGLLIGAACLALTAEGDAGIPAAGQLAPVRQLTIPSAPLSKYLPASVSSAVGVLDGRFDERAAMDLVQFMDRYWRNAANEGFNASIDRIKARLVDAGFAARGAGPADGPSAWTEEFGRAQGWDYSVGTLTLAADPSKPDEVLLSRDQHRVALCINSFSTPPGGVVAPIVDVGQGAAAADYDGKDVRGAVVLGDAGLGRLWQMAVVQRGAIGVVSTALEPYIRPGPEGTPADRRPKAEWDVLQWSSVPYDETRRGFGFKATPRAAVRIRARLAEGPARVRVDVASTFSPGPVRSLVAEIPGAATPGERVVLVAHVQEPGANDNASGCATLLELARAVLQGIREKKISAPGRTLTFIWGDEIRASRQWMQDHPAEAKQVRYMFSLDMTGENTRLTGGSFLIEKAPDPAAVWPRPSDPHTEWGSSPVKAESLKGTLLNDLFLAVCQCMAWKVQTNPYEGGSDHAVFLAAGVPSVLAWHFPDRFYHSSLDRPGMTDPAEMKYVGVGVAATALLLAGAAPRDAIDVVRLVEQAAISRLALERRQGAGLVKEARDRAAAEATEAAVIAAWRKWYGEALREALELPPGGADLDLRSAVDRALQRIATR
jgi:aminopeptidase YwaD